MAQAPAQAPATIQPVPQPVQFTTLDRCDACGVTAHAQATLSSGGMLLFCGHHFTIHKAALTKAGATLVDHTPLIDSPR